MPWFRSLLALVIVSGAAVAADWPGWLGPQRDSASPEKVAPWKEAPKVLWKLPGVHEVRAYAVIDEVKNSAGVPL